MNWLDEVFDFLMVVVLIALFLAIPVLFTMGVREPKPTCDDGYVMVWGVDKSRVCVVGKLPEAVR